jgi:hypothetical protein
MGTKYVCVELGTQQALNLGASLSYEQPSTACCQQATVLNVCEGTATSQQFCTESSLKENL